MPSLYKTYGLIMVVLNALWIIMELCFFGIGIHELHVYKKHLDKYIPPGDSVHLSYMPFYIGRFILICGIICIIFDILANLSLYFHTRDKVFCGGLKFYVITTIIITIISIPCIVVFDFAGYQTFGYDTADCRPVQSAQYNPRRCYPAKYRITLLCFWTFKIVYNVVVLVINLPILLLFIGERRERKEHPAGASTLSVIPEFQNNADKQDLLTINDSKVKEQAN